MNKNTNPNPKDMILRTFIYSIVLVDCKEISTNLSKKCSILTPDIRKQPKTSLESI